eukprot:2119376-Pyramimonas_sp.AAC.1
MMSSRPWQQKVSSRCPRMAQSENALRAVWRAAQMRRTRARVAAGQDAQEAPGVGTERVGRLQGHSGNV